MWRRESSLPPPSSSRAITAHTTKRHHRLQPAIYQVPFLRLVPQTNEYRHTLPLYFNNKDWSVHPPERIINARQHGTMHASEGIFEVQPQRGGSGGGDSRLAAAPIIAGMSPVWSIAELHSALSRQQGRSSHVFKSEATEKCTASGGGK